MSRIMKNSEFRDFLSRSALSATQASTVLGISEPSIHYAKKNDSLIKDSVALKAIAFEEASRTTVGDDASSIDSAAEWDDLHELCAELAHAHITGMTSAIYRGWTSANTNCFRDVEQPVRMKRPEKACGADLNWGNLPDTLLWGVEIRRDLSGRPYRIASIERTLLFIVFNEREYSSDDIEEVFVGALSSEQKPDRDFLRKKASEYGILDKMDYYLNHSKIYG